MLVAGQGVEINAGGSEEPRLVHLRKTKPQGVTVAKRVQQQGMHDRQNLNMDKPDTIITFGCQHIEGVITCFGNVVPVLPCIGCLVVTDD